MVEFFVTQPAPSLASISPSFAAPDASVSVTLTGERFTADSRIEITGRGVTFSDVVVVDDTTITATMTVDADAPAGFRRLKVVARGLASAAILLPVYARGIVATGGTTHDEDVDGVPHRVHVFTASGDFEVSDLGESDGAVEYLLGASGGTGARNSSAASGVAAGGGGGGEVVEGETTVAVGTHAVVIGAAVAGPTTLRNGFNGNDSTALGKTAKGGGAGVWQLPCDGMAGGNGGGAGAQTNTSGTGGAALTANGHRGGNGNGTPTTYAAGGGGGAGENGGDAVGTTPGKGGDGKVAAMDGVRYGGGGGGQSSTGAVGAGGLGGGTAAGSPSSSCAANTCAGSGASITGQPGSSGSGICKIRYPLVVPPSEDA